MQTTRGTRILATFFQNRFSTCMTCAMVQKFLQFVVVVGLWDDGRPHQPCGLDPVASLWGPGGGKNSPDLSLSRSF